MSDSVNHELLRGTAVAVGTHALLFIGKSGSGKSSLALELISRGATLIGDDRVVATSVAESGILLSPPDRLRGVIEARNFGLLQMETTSAVLRAVVDLDSVEKTRLPDAHETVIAGEVVPLIRKVESSAFAAMLLAYLRGGRRDE